MEATDRNGECQTLKLAERCLKAGLQRDLDQTLRPSQISKSSSAVSSCRFCLTGHLTRRRYLRGDSTPIVRCLKEFGDRRELVLRHLPSRLASVGADRLDGGLRVSLVRGSENPAGDRRQSSAKSTGLRRSSGAEEHSGLSPHGDQVGHRSRSPLAELRVDPRSEARTERSPAIPLGQNSAASAAIKIRIRSMPRT